MKIKEMFNSVKYKRKLNAIKTKYDETLESKVRDKEEITRLQRDLLAAKTELSNLKDVVDYYKRKYEKKEVKKRNG